MKDKVLRERVGYFGGRITRLERRTEELELLIRDLARAEGHTIAYRKGYYVQKEKGTKKS